MDQLPHPRRSRWHNLAAGVVLAVIALGTLAIIAPEVFAQAKDAATTTAPATAPAAANDVISADASPQRWEGFQKVAIVVSLFVVPIIIGSWLAKALRMPDHGWKFAVAIGTIAAAAVVVSRGEVKLGPDLSGGITLVYELADQQADAPEAGGKQAPGAAGAKSADGKDLVALLIGVLNKRIDPTGTKEVSIRKYGEGQIEIIIPKADKQELEYIERRISTAGMLVFRITASPRFPKHQGAINIAMTLPASQNIVKQEDGTEIARWVELDETEFPSIEAAKDRGLVTRVVGKTPQALVMTDDGLDVVGKDISTVAPDIDETGKPQVSFGFDSSGAFRFGQLTGRHIPTASGQQYNLGILLDNRLLSAPTIQSKITDRGRISGNMSQKEVDFLVGILKAGQLPAALNKVPISRAQISPTLGAQTIEKGKLSLEISLLLVAIFMVVYYRVAGVIACFGLAINMLLIVGSMVLIKAAFTLPGLAGLVLTVGMSVDANVLIYERIREELKRGAALRMAIRNGFDRATTTIIDSNVTNLITGIVIYKIAPDNVKGFGITLVLGIAMSIFVAVFLTRIAFDVLERKGIIKTLYMMEFIGETKMDFLKWQRACILGSALVIGIGLVGVASRGGDLFDIDFTGGSSVQFVLKDDQKMDFDAVLAVLDTTTLKDKNLSLVEIGKTNTRYTVTTVDDDVNDVERILSEAFAGKLKTYKVEVTDLKPITATAGMERALPGLARGQFLPGLPLPVSYFMLQAAPAGDAPATTNDQSPAPAAAAPTGDAPSGDAGASAPAPAADAAATPAEATTSDAAATAPASTAPAEAPATTDTKPASTEDKPAASAGETTENPFAAGGASGTIKFSSEVSAKEDVTLAGGVSYNTLEQLLIDSLKAEGHEGVAFELSNPDYTRGTERAFTEWTVKVALPEADAQKVLDRIEKALDNQPVFPLSNKIGGRVAARMATDAIAAIILCLAGIIGYVWFRFHGVIYGVAAVVALIHDVLISLGFVALSAYLVNGAEPLANALLIGKFQVSLTLVAAFLTIIGYSLNDTIVIFDRIREVKGKSPRLTKEMINLAVNQCFARTLLTSFTALISVFVLYVVGGEGIHAFAFALLVGFISGVYSTIYIANPVLLWLAQRAEGATATSGSKAA